MFMYVNIYCDYLSRYSAEEIHFNLMAIVSDRLQQYQKGIDDIQKQIEVSQYSTSQTAWMWSSDHDLGLKMEKCHLGLE